MKTLKILALLTTFALSGIVINRRATSTSLGEWDDIRIVPTQFDFAGVADPSAANFQPQLSGTIMRAFEFQLDDCAFFSVQLPHSYKQGSAIYAHVHWSPNGQGNEEFENVVVWKIEYVWANVNSAFTPSASVTIEDSVSGIDHYHEMTQNTEIAGTGKTISSMLLCKISRPDVLADTWSGTNSGSLPVLLEVDFHYSMDTVGSHSISSK